MKKISFDSFQVTDYFKDGKKRVHNTTNLNTDTIAYARGATQTNVPLQQMSINQILSAKNMTY